MEKAKTGDQRFKRPSRIPYVVAGLSFIFFISCLLFVMLTLTRPRQGEIEPTPTLNEAEIQALAQALWEHPVPIPPYMKIKVLPRKSMGQVEICAVIFLNPDTLQTGIIIAYLDRFAIDGINYSGVGTGGYEDGRLAAQVCETLTLTSGNHLIEIQGASGAIFYEGAIRVD